MNVEPSNSIIDVKECAACGLNHDGVQTVEKVKTVSIFGEPDTRGATTIRFFYCPENGQQVFVEKAHDAS